MGNEIDPRDRRGYEVIVVIPVPDITELLPLVPFTEPVVEPAPPPPTVIV